MRSLFYNFLFLAMVLPVTCFSNTAQPGIFHAGGTMDFTLLFPEDSGSVRKIQMVDELVAIQLYRGFAVVKGEYKMYNTTDSAITIKVGYPVNTQYKATGKSSVATTIFFDQLYALKSYTNHKENFFLVQPGQAGRTMDENNWYAWVDTFRPKDTTIISVYFIVNTNNATIIEGYTNDANNAFIYLLETGAMWQQPILKGEVKIQLMDNLKIGDIRGITPASVFEVDNGRNMLV